MGQGGGQVAETLMAHNFDAGSLRPYLNGAGQACITVNGQEQITTNAPATLRKDEWIHLDGVVLKAAKARLNVVADLRQGGLEYNIPNGLGKTTLEHEAQSDIGDAQISMDGIRESEGGRPQYDLRSLPLPIIHKDFSFSARQVATSRNSNTPLDLSTAELAARRVAEEAEKLALGELSAYQYGGGSVYGFKNFPNRLTKSMTAPTSSNHDVTVREVLEMRKQSTDNNYFGPWCIYYSPAWYAYMDEDYRDNGNNTITLRERLMKIQGIDDIKPADYLTGNDMIMVQKTADVARMVVGMDVTTLQWPSQGGMQLNYKVMAILVPQIRGDYTNQTGIIHGTFS